MGSLIPTTGQLKTAGFTILILAGLYRLGMKSEIEGNKKLFGIF